MVRNKIVFLGVILSTLCFSASSPVIYGPTNSAQILTASMLFPQVPLQANPPATYDKLYFKNDDNLYKLTSAGVETLVSGGGGGGTVTSVALTAPGIFSVGGSPVVNAGTLALSLVNENANSVWAGPTVGGATAPTFRLLVAADIPALPYQPSFTPGDISTSTTGVNIGSGASSTVGPSVTVNVQTATGAQPGLLSAADWTTFNGKQNALTIGNLTDAGTDGLTVTNGAGSVIGAGTSLSQHVADTTHNGYLLAADWNTFNGKQSALTIGNLTDAGTDGITVTNGAGSVIGTGTSVDQHVSDATHNGYLGSSDWNTFNGKFTLPAFTAGSVLFSDGSTIIQDNSKFFWDDTNFRLSLGGHLNTAALGISSSLAQVALQVTSTGANTALDVQNQGAQFAAQFTNATNSATQGAAFGGAFARGTLAAKTAVQAGDQVATFTGQSYNGASFGPGYNAAVAVIATENQTAAHNGGELVLATTPNLSLAPVAGLIVNQDQTLQIPHYTSNGFVKTSSANGSVTIDTTAYGTGSVTSVAMTVPAFLSVAGSPITTSGTLAVSLSGTALPIANGGTSATTKAGAFDALSPMTTGGDLIYGGASGTGTRLANGSLGQVLTSAGTTLAPTWQTPTTGTVTSVSQTVPAEFSIAGSPVTTSGTLAITKATETANTVWAGPTSGGAVQPSFRALVTADIPTVIPHINTTLQVTTYTAVANDAVICNATGGAFTVTIPLAAANTNELIWVKKTDVTANAITITASGADTIDGLATVTLAKQSQGITLMSDGTNWNVF